MSILAKNGFAKKLLNGLLKRKQPQIKYIASKCRTISKNITKVRTKK